MVNNKKYYYYFENEKLSIDEVELHEMIKEAIIKVLIDDPYTMPLNVLVIKTIKEVKEKKQNLFIRREVIQTVIDDLLEKTILEISEHNKYYLGYLDYPASDVVLEGNLQIDNKKGNGFVAVQDKNADEATKLPKNNGYQKATHFVHRKNLNGAKHGDYVKIVELVIDLRRKKLKLNLKDAKVLEILIKREDEKESFKNISEE